MQCQNAVETLERVYLDDLEFHKCVDAVLSMKKYSFCDFPRSAGIEDGQEIK